MKSNLRLTIIINVYLVTTCVSSGAYRLKAMTRVLSAQNVEKNTH